MRARSQQGAQAVEFALVLPFLVLIIFAVFDFFLLAYNKSVITNASREAARQAVVLTAPTTTWATRVTQAQTRACDYMRNMLISAGTGSINSTCTGTNAPTISITPASAPAFNDPITVTVSYTPRGFSLGSIYNLAASGVGSPMTLTATTRMLQE